MSRKPRAGSPGRPRAVRVTDIEWQAWERAAKQVGHVTISAAIVNVMNAWARRTERRAPTETVSRPAV